MIFNLKEEEFLSKFLKTLVGEEVVEREEIKEEGDLKNEVVEDMRVINQNLKEEAVEEVIDLVIQVPEEDEGEAKQL